MAFLAMAAWPSHSPVALVPLAGVLTAVRLAGQDRGVCSMLSVHR